MRSSRLPCRHVRCGGVALGRRSSAAAARTLCAVRVFVICGARYLRAAVGELSRPSGRSPSRCPRGAAGRGAARALLAPTTPPHPMRWCGALPALLCGGGSRSLHSERRRHWRRALSAGGRRRVVASFRAVTVALLSQRGCSRRSSCAPRVCRAAASDAAVWRSATAPLQRRFALSARRRSQHTMPAPHRRRLALTSGSRADRTARCVAHHARNACAPSASRADRTHCAPSAHDSRAHTATIAPGAPRRSAPPPARRRLTLASGSRADRTARCAAHHARNTSCGFRFARRPHRNIARRVPMTRAHTQPQSPQYAATQRSP